GLLVEGTCDEIGRRHVWVALGPEGPRTVTFATRLGSLAQPSDLAERLPKALIHRNVPGEPVHAFLRDFDRAWAAAAPYASYGARQRWIRAVRDLTADWPVTDGPVRWRQGEVTVRREALAPRTGAHRRDGRDSGRMSRSLGRAGLMPGGLAASFIRNLFRVDLAS